MEGEKKFCGVDREQLFSKCIIPVLTTICENRNGSMIDIIRQLVQQIAAIESNASDEEDEPDAQKQSRQADHQMQNLQENYYVVPGVNLANGGGMRNLPNPSQHQTF